MDVRIDGVRYREPLGTRDRGEAGELMHKRLEQLKTKAPDPEKRNASFGVLNIKHALQAYTKMRRGKVSDRMIAYWTEQARPLEKHFGDVKLKRFTVEHLLEYQNAEPQHFVFPWHGREQKIDAARPTHLLALCVAFYSP